jgi:hypothetical protein
LGDEGTMDVRKEGGREGGLLVLSCWHRIHLTIRGGREGRKEGGREDGRGRSCTHLLSFLSYDHIF